MTTTRTNKNVEQNDKMQSRSQDSKVAGDEERAKLILRWLRNKSLQQLCFWL